MAAPIGNQNAKKAKRWQKAIERALARASNENVDAGLDKAADIFVKACYDGDLASLKELGDRIDGKPTQVIGGDPDSPLELNTNLSVSWGNAGQPAGET
jgi:hypothetical protein